MRHSAVAFAIGATCGALAAHWGNADYFAFGTWVTAGWLLIQNRRA